MRHLLSIVFLSLTTASVALAGPKCTDGKNDNWIAETEMKKILTNRGYTWEVFKVSRGNCYEIYGHDASGKKVETYFNPETAKIVKEKS